MKLSKSDIIDIFTVSCGVSGALTVIIGTVTYASGLLGMGTIHLGKILDHQRPTLHKMMVYGSTWVGTGLFATGLAMGVARSAAKLSADEESFSDDEIAFLKKIKPCSGCKYFHGVNYHGVDLICSLHPHGVDTDSTDSCPDWESDK
jgi:hypothetical protein